MAIKFQFVEPAGQGNLGPAVTVEDLLAGIAGFQGLWTAGIGETLAAGKIAAWAVRRGVGNLAQAAAARQGIKTVRDGLDVVAFDGTNALGLDTVIGSAAAFTLGVRFYQKSYATDSQILFGQDLATPFARVMSRFANSQPAYQFQGETNTPSPGIVISPPADGWRTLILAQGSGQAKLIVNELPILSATSAALNLPTFSLGHGRATAGSARIDVRSVFMAASDVSANSEALANLKRGLAAL